MAKEWLVACTVECVPITVQYLVTCYLKYVINGKTEIVYEWRVILNHE